MDKLDLKDAYIGVSDVKRDGKRYVEFVKYNSHKKDEIVDKKLEVDQKPIEQAVIRSECCKAPTYSGEGDPLDIIHCETCKKVCNSYLDIYGN